MKNTLNKYFIFILVSIVCFNESCDSGKGKELNKDNSLSGSAIFGKYCVTCHGANGKLGLNGAFNLPESPLNLEERISVITNGRKAMASYKGILNAEQIKAVAEYTMTLK